MAIRWLGETGLGETGNGPPVECGFYLEFAPKPAESAPEWVRIRYHAAIGAIRPRKTDICFWKTNTGLQSSELSDEEILSWYELSGNRGVKKDGWFAPVTLFKETLLAKSFPAAEAECADNKRARFRLKSARTMELIRRRLLALDESPT
ncbi:uncharacterized protein DNG_09640 [Cephalotrichum gorgonifer]|uniref:Uncharacterized protein n=1 Tax=Cephalotrichum gorgonifer TaxID=2041049 RepID=A0AAE8SZH0_9PEZI|nr:uncharacterized protein DNG_09640 [Cephalotrichum gorgonifer]